MMVGLLGILKSGAAYLPLDPEYPQDRLRLMIDDAYPAPHPLSQQKNCSQSFLPAGPTLVWNTSWITNLPDNPGSGELSPIWKRAITKQDPAYVMYTSGSSGRPKAVIMPHSSLVNLIYYMEASNDPASTNVAQFTALSFDVSAQEIFSALSSSKTLFIPFE